MANVIETDVVIIGAGPVGLFTIFELGYWDISAHVVDILPRPGGQCAELYPEKPIYDIPGMPSVTGQALVDGLVEQAKPFGPVYHFEQIITKINKLDNDRFSLETDTGTRFQAKAVIIAAGGGSFQPKKPPVPGVEEFEAHSVLYSVKKRDQLAGADVIVAGGGNSALDWCMDLVSIAKSVTLVHRRAQFRASPDSVNKVLAMAEKGDINFHVGQITALKGNEGRLERVTIKTAQSETDVNAQYLLAFFGLTMKLGPIAEWGLQLNDNQIEVDTEKFQSSIEGIYAVGDINHYPGKMPIILSGFHEAALCAQAIYKKFNPEKRLVVQYTTSSTKFLKKIGVKPDVSGD